MGRTFLALGEASPGPRGAEAAGAEGSGAGRSRNGVVVEVGDHTTNVYPPGSKESPIAWLVAIWPPVVLCVPSWGQDTVAMLTFQAEGVPVLAQRTHFLREENRLLATRAGPTHGSAQCVQPVLHTVGTAWGLRSRPLCWLRPRLSFETHWAEFAAPGRPLVARNLGCSTWGTAGNFAITSKHQSLTGCSAVPCWVNGVLAVSLDSKTRWTSVPSAGQWGWDSTLLFPDLSPSVPFVYNTCFILLVNF